MNDTDGWLAGTAPLDRRNAAELVLQALRDAVVSGQFPAGSRLPSETRLAQAYGVSRPVIREALRALQTIGLTTTRTGSGTWVLANDPPALGFGRYSARDLAEARPGIEVPAAGWAARRRSDDQAARLMELCDAMEAQTVHSTYVRLDTDFHALIAAASQNAVFTGIVTDARDSLMRQSELLNVMAARMTASNQEHRRIAQAICDGDPDAAEDAMRVHLAAVARVIDHISAPKTGKS